jgi:hypothetical protein
MVELPPRDKWMASGESIVRWRPLFEVIEVRPHPPGVMLILRLDGVEREIELDTTCVKQLLSRLGAAQAASEAASAGQAG